MGYPTGCKYLNIKISDWDKISQLENKIRSISAKANELLRLAIDEYKIKPFTINPMINRHEDNKILPVIDLDIYDYIDKLKKGKKYFKIEVVSAFIDKGLEIYNKNKQDVK
jgi:hypothetical protein